MAFPTIGLRAVFEINDFQKAHGKYVSSIMDMDKSTSDFAGDVSRAFKAVTSVVAVAAGAIGAVGAGALKLAVDAKGIPAITESFDNLGGSLESLQTASAGMVRQTELMKNFNLAAQLVSTDFAQKLPDAMQYLSKVAASTGQSMDYMMNSLIRGVGRVSPMILDNLGVQVDLTAANEAYAKSIGKTADELTKTEQQTAVMNETMRLLKENTASMPEVIGTLSAEWDAVTVSMLDLKDSVGAALAPALESVIGPLSKIAEEYGPKMVEWAATLGQSLSKTLPDIITGFHSLLGVVESVANVLGKFDLAIVGVSVGLAGLALGLASLGGLTGIIAGLTSAFETLYLVMLMNPVFALAAGIVAAGIAISAVVKSIENNNVALAATASTVALASESYAQYTARMVDAARETGNYQMLTQDADVAQVLLANDVLLTEEAFNRYKTSVENTGPALQGLDEGLLSTGELIRMQREEMAATIAVFDEAASSLDISSAFTAEFDAARAAGADFSAFMTEQFADTNNGIDSALKELGGLVSDHLEDIAKTQADHRMTEMDAELRYGMDRVEAQAKYQAEAMGLMAIRIRESGTQVHVPDDLPVVRGDRPRLLSVMQNLLDNAVKFMGDQAQPRIEIDARREGAETVCWVRDNGIGIDPKYHDRVFGLFDQLNRDTPEGTGIGLALVKRIVEVHGGRIWIESEGKGRGSTFCFSLPRKGESDDGEEE